MIEKVFEDSDYVEARQELARARDLEALRSKLKSYARYMSPVKWMEKPAEQSICTLSDLSNWQRLGVSVVNRPMVNSGGAKVRDGVRRIFVSSSDSEARQRFTVAHEIAHLLLADVRREQKVSPDIEEVLCNQFAGEFLIPKDLLSKAVKRWGTLRLTLSRLEELCRSFAVNYQPMIIALRRADLLPDDLCLFARMTGHSKRQDEVEYRVDFGFRHRFFYVPAEKRLQSLGLKELADWAEIASPGEIGSGWIPDLQLSLSRKGGGYGQAEGEVTWEAKVLKARRLIVILETSQLRFHWVEPRRKVRKRT